MSKALVSKLEKYAEAKLNVLLIGSHGIGKTTIVKAIADKLGLKFKYYSSSTLDPFADLVGIPAPDKESNSLKFYRPKDLEEAEFILFDEMNRAHPRVLNAILEIIQFKSVNGYKLPNLKMVWSCINPPGEDYQVEELDPALVDRFHIYIKMKAEISMEYFSSVMNKDLAKVLKNWWEDSLDDEQRKIFTPRRLEYVGMMIQNGIPWRDAIPYAHTFPVDELTRRIKIMNNEEEDILVNKENILEKKDMFVKKIKEDPKFAIPISAVMTRFSEEELFECRDLLEGMPKELVFKISERKFLMKKRAFKQTFLANNIDTTKYPKISEAFDFGIK